MKLAVVLAVLVGTLVLACSTVTPVPAEPTPNIDATVEAKVAQERAVDATVQAKVSGTLSAQEAKTPSTTQSACKLTGGETVQSGWTGKDTGDNSCNSCFCTNGVLGCTKMACPAHQVSSNSKPTPTRPPTLTTKSTPTRPPTSTTKPTPTPEPTIKPGSTTEVAPTATLAWREYVYTSEGERVKVVPPPTVPPAAQGPPQGTSVMSYIPGLGTTVESVGFFDMGGRRIGTGYGGEVAQDTFAKLDATHAYRDSFWGSESAFIGWELRLTHTAGFHLWTKYYVIAWELYREDVLVQEGENEAYISPNWTASWKSSGMGSEIPGQFFVPGDYRVDFFLDGEFAARGWFDVR